MIVLLLILIPLIGGVVTFFLKEEKAARCWALLIAFATLAVSIFGLTIAKAPEQLAFSTSWLGSLGSRFSIALDGLSHILCLLTAIAYPLIFLATWNTSYKKANNFFGLMLLPRLPNHEVEKANCSGVFAMVKPKTDTAKVAKAINKAHPRAAFSSFKKKETTPPIKGININNKTIIQPPVPRWGNLVLKCSVSLPNFLYSSLLFIASKLNSVIQYKSATQHKLNSDASVCYKINNFVNKELQYPNKVSTTYPDRTSL
jgi:hypothetical protein